MNRAENSERPDIETRRRSIARKTNIISLAAVAIGGAIAVYYLDGEVLDPKRYGVFALVLLYVIFRFWRLRRN